MDCSKFQDDKLLDAYGDLEVEPEGYRDHVESCAGCRGDLEDLREISEQYRLASIERLPRIPQVRRRRDYWIPAVAAALLIAVTVGVLLWPSRPSPAPLLPQANTEAPAVHKPETIPLPAWDADDEAFDREIREIDRRLDRLEREIKRRNS